MKKPSALRVLTAAALACAAVLTAAGPAAADVRPTRPCAAGEISAEIGEGHSPSPGTSRLFTIWLKGHEGVDCLLSGALDYIRFYDTSGRPLDDGTGQLIPLASGARSATPPHTDRAPVVTVPQVVVRLGDRVARPRAIT